MAPTSKGLAVDQGCGSDEEWPWRRCEDYAGDLQREPPITVFALPFLVASAAAVPLVGIFSGVVIAFVVGMVATSFAESLGRPERWTGRRIRDLEMAEYRAHRALMLVDPDFAAELWSPERRDVETRE